MTGLQFRYPPITRVWHLTKAGLNAAREMNDLLCDFVSIQANGEQKTIRRINQRKRKANNPVGTLRRLGVGFIKLAELGSSAFGRCIKWSEQKGGNSFGRSKIRTLLTPTFILAIRVPNSKN